MSEIRVNFGALSEGQAGILATHKQMEESLSTLESQLQAMLQTWDGEAREAYYASKQQWDSAAQKMAVTLQQIGNLVGTANENYGAAERAARNTWQ